MSGNEATLTNTSVRAWQGELCQVLVFNEEEEEEEQQEIEEEEEQEEKKVKIMEVSLFSFFCTFWIYICALYCLVNIKFCKLVDPGPAHLRKRNLQRETFILVIAVPMCILVLI